MSKVTEQSVRFQTAFASIKFIQAYAVLFFFFNDTAITEIYTLSLHNALPLLTPSSSIRGASTVPWRRRSRRSGSTASRSEEHTSELQSRENIVCRPLLDK